MWKQLSVSSVLALQLVQSRKGEHMKKHGHWLEVYYLIYEQSQLDSTKTER